MSVLNLTLLATTICLPTCFSAEHSVEIQRALESAGANRMQLEQALKDVPEEQLPGMQFLIRQMPERDATSLTADFLLRNVKLAYEAKDGAPWGDTIPDHIFLNGILPYASINESRDDWRQRFRDRFLPLVKDARTPAEAAARLNQKIFPMLSVKYSTKRRRADQGPFESIDSGLASCTGLSILLIDACRSVGVPARFVGTPLWSDGSGNHSWVEVWDDGWHFTGAAEPTGDVLDRAWFIGRASGAIVDDPRHAIYAVSFQQTPLKFPLVWDRGIDYVSAVNVTQRYLDASRPLPEGHARVMFMAVRDSDDERLRADVVVTADGNETVFEGRTNDERFDRNDHLTATLPLGRMYQALFSNGGNVVTVSFTLTGSEQLIRAEFAAGDK